jgi:hypothetical protein
VNPPPPSPFPEADAAAPPNGSDETGPNVQGPATPSEAPPVPVGVADDATLVERIATLPNCANFLFDTTLIDGYIPDIQMFMFWFR